MAFRIRSKSRSPFYRPYWTILHKLQATRQAYGQQYILVFRLLCLKAAPNAQQKGQHTLSFSFHHKPPSQQFISLQSLSMRVVMQWTAQFLSLPQNLNLYGLTNVLVVNRRTLIVAGEPYAVSVDTGCASHMSCVWTIHPVVMGQQSTIVVSVPSIVFVLFRQHQQMVYASRNNASLNRSIVSPARHRIHSPSPTYRMMSIFKQTMQSQLVK